MRSPGGLILTHPYPKRRRWQNRTLSVHHNPGGGWPFFFSFLVPTAESYEVDRPTWACSGWFGAAFREGSEGRVPGVALLGISPGTSFFLLVYFKTTKEGYPEQI